MLRLTVSFKQHCLYLEGIVRGFLILLRQFLTEFLHVWCSICYTLVTCTVLEVVMDYTHAEYLPVEDACSCVTGCHILITLGDIQLG